MTIVPPPPARSPERARLLKALAQRRSNRSGILRRSPAGPLVPASYAQAGLWMVTELEQGSSAYNVPLPVSLRGPLDTGALRGALTRVVERHEALRTTFTEHDGVLYQVIGAPAPVPLPVLDLTGPAADEVPRRLAAAQTARFDLGAGPVLRAELLRLAPRDHLLLLTVHHIACDGWSVPLLHAELADGYNSAVRGVPSALPPLPVQYADFACWERDRLDAAERERLTGYWRTRLDGAEMTLPTDRPDDPARTAEGDLCRATIPEPTVDRLDRIARAEGASRFMTVAALLAVLLARCTGRRDLLFGSTVAQRQQPELRHLIGLFTNAFPVRADLSGNPTFRQVLARTRRDLIADYEGSALPFGLLVDALRTERSGTRTPLIRVHVQLEESDGGSTAYQRLPAYDGLTVKGLVPELRAAKFDLNFMVRADSGALVLDLVYARDLFDPATAERLAAMYALVADAVAARPDRGIGDLLLPEPPRPPARVSTAVSVAAPAPEAGEKTAPARGVVEGTAPASGGVEGTAPAPGVVVGGAAREGEAVAGSGRDRGAVEGTVPEPEAVEDPGPAAEAGGDTAPEMLERVRHAWREVLGADEVHPHSDFFDLGGNSFAALKVRRLLGGGVPLAELFRHRTAAALAAYLADGARPSADRLLWPLTGDDSAADTTVIAIPYAGGAATAYQPLADALPPRFRLWAASLPGHEGDDGDFLEFDEAVSRLADEVRERVSGAVMVYGHCAGASLAVAVARELEARGADLRAVHVGASLTDPDAEANLARVTGSTGDEFYAYIKAIGGFDGPLDEADRHQVLAAVRHDMAGATRFQAAAHKSPGARLRAPLHCVLGTADPVTPDPEHGYRGWSVFAETVRLELVAGGGHYFARDHAAELARVIGATVAAAPAVRLPVVCLPHTGAGASFFRPWQVRGDVEIIAPDLAGHDKRFGEPPHRTVAAAVADLLPRVLSALDGRDEAVLVGHCLGGTVAFELAGLLLEHGVRLRHLIISGTPGPTVPRHRRTTGLPDREFLARLEELAGYAHPALADPEMAALLLPVLRADQEMYENYRRTSVTPLDVPVTVLRGAADALVSAADSARWQEATTRPLRYAEVAGGHMYLADDSGPVLELIEWLADGAEDRVGTLLAAQYPAPDWGLPEPAEPASRSTHDLGPVPRHRVLAAAAVVLGRYHGLPVTVLALRESAAARRPALVAFPTDPATPVAALLAVAEEALEGTWPRFGPVLAGMLGDGAPVVEVRFHEAGDTEFPLTLTVGTGLTTAVGGGPVGRWAGDRFASAVVHVAGQLAAGKGDLAGLELLDAAGRSHVRRLGDGGEPPAERRRIDDLVAARAAERPDATAITDRNIRLSYGILDRAANRVARALRELGVEHGDRVGVCMARGWELVVVLLGVLRAGAAYLPMEPDNPPQRLARTARAGTPRLVVTASADFPAGTWRSVSPASLAGLAERQPPTPPARTGDAGDAAYVICTSGSTGTPKPVVVAHRSVTALIAGTGTEFAFADRDVWAFFHSVAFDMSVWEIWGALTTGGRLVVVPQRVTRVPEELHRLLAEERVTILNQTPTAFGMLVEADRGASSALAVRLVTFGGEPLDTRALLPWFRRHPPHLCRLVNLYGITETTVHSTWTTVTPRMAETASRSVGVPLPGESLSIRDRAGRLLPPGVPGEIHVGGVGVALGYLGLDDLTAERFGVDEDGTRVYRSGDRGRMLPDGTVEHLGRLDDQVKLRGYRIELGEVRAALLAADGVTAAAVVVGGTPDAARLNAYVTPAGVDPLTIRHRVRALLPEYMVPATITALGALPLTANGKLDRARLPRPGPEPASGVAAGSGVPAASGVPAGPGVSAASGVPAGPGVSAASGVPAGPGVSAASGVPAGPGVSAASGVPAAPAVPTAPGVPARSAAPAAPLLPVPTEDQLTEIWEQLTGLRIRGDDNVFDAGGNSVVVSRFVAELRARGLAGPAVGDVYRLGTLRGLADRLRSRSA
ncbi:amino acid adenylation domain-containing protein [Streptomyces sp. MB22_4]|uniref:amino acid adenylation domain-containing protein n=1 Tax=Streptomyces sp. MB22_4 TaxID=3383120 RepID=UPI0039A36A3B